jgi:hypothetical protein
VKWVLTILFVLFPFQLFALNIKQITPVKIEYKNNRVVRAVAYRFIRKYLRSYINEDREKFIDAASHPVIALDNYPFMGFNRIRFSRKPILQLMGFTLSEDLRVRVDIKEILGRDLFLVSNPDPPRKRFKTFRPKLIGSNSKARLNISLDRDTLIKSLGIKLSKTYQYYNYKIVIQAYARHKFRNKESVIGFEVRII